MEFDSIEHFVWRTVELQSQVSTKKLVYPNDEQTRLEQIIEISKPRFPNEFESCHPLIYTPFRYPNSNGSRFGAPNSSYGILYASFSAHTCITEFTFLKLLFFLDSPETPWPSNPIQATAFSLSISSSRYLRYPEPNDLIAWADTRSYEECRIFAEEARSNGCTCIGYRSARDTKGYNVAVLSRTAISSGSPVDTQTWHVKFSSDGAYARSENPRKSLEFDRNFFAADARLTQYPWDRPLAIWRRNEP